MIQVRCPECGYLQSLSEDRFISITEDSIECPHCSAKVPKEWSPETSESAPEEAQHKMLAFSRRILNGGEISREMVYALESLVRRYQPGEDCAKALGIGYAQLGEAEKAEEFLMAANKEDPADLSVQRSLLEVLLAQDDYHKAERIGASLLDSLGHSADADIVGMVALALLGGNKLDKAEALLKSRLDLDLTNPFIKHARKELNRAKGGGLISLLGDWNPLSRVFGRPSSEALGVVSRKARALLHPYSDSALSEIDALPLAPGDKVMSVRRPEYRKTLKIAPAIEYWIYCSRSAIPRLEDIRDRLSQVQEEDSERENILEMFDSFVEKDQLRIDHILKADSKELFDYPEDLIPRISRGFEESDLQKLNQARMIIRIRLSPKGFRPKDYIPFMTGLVEAVRELTGGVVQDAVSHTLWGTEEWKSRVLADPMKYPIESQLHFESLDEGGNVWIHSHGMLKFGLPEMELEGIPAELAAAGRKMIILAGKTLIDAGAQGLDFNAEMDIPHTPFNFRMEVREQDAEGHFPAGSVRILPYLPQYDPHSPDTAKHVLRMLNAKFRNSVGLGRKSEPPSAQFSEVETVDAQKKAAHQRLLEAHKRAMSGLAAFKKSFKESDLPTGDIHAVKIGFPVHGGDYEWMWVSLEAWRGASLVGQLENSPIRRKDLHKGSTVHVSEREVFDWAIVSRSGALLNGAYTEKIQPPRND
jgi:uncharacterized protein YegJ (DUF2314 family)